MLLRRSIFLATLTLGLAGLCGCAGGGLSAPRDRLGALPFPGAFTLYTTADPARLGTHRCGRLPRALGGDEKERGILYTTRGGFVDVAHVRIAIDWGRYCTRLARAAIADRRPALAVAGELGDVFHVALDYPNDWPALAPADRAAAVDAAATRVGQQVAYLVLTWHELATWFGHRTFLFDESRSAFTYDDTVAALVGLRVAERAMAAAGIDGDDAAFESAATAALDAELRRLGACTPAQTERAVRAVEGVWWSSGGEPLKRQADVDTAGAGVVRPWLVPGLPFAGGEEPEAFRVPTGRVAVGGRPAVGARVEIEPRIGEAGAMRALLPGRPVRFDDRRDVPALLAVVRAQMRERYGADVGRPWPEDAAAAAARTARAGGAPPVD